MGNDSRGTIFRQFIEDIIGKEGYFSVYTSVSAAILRQTLYHSTRLGVYLYLFEKASGPEQGVPSFMTKTRIGLLAGIAGAFAAVPSDIAQYRMQADGRSTLSERSKYPDIINALIRELREQGYRSLWRGAVPTMARAMVFNVTQLVSYSESKQSLLENNQFEEDSIGIPVTAGLFSTLVTTIASMPFDLVKLRLQSHTGSYYKGTRNVLFRAIKRDGVLSLWRGFIPYYARQAPLTVLMFLCLEKLKLNNYY